MMEEMFLIRRRMLVSVGGVFFFLVWFGGRFWVCFLNWQCRLVICSGSWV